MAARWDGLIADLLGLGSGGLAVLLAGCRCGPLLLAVPLLGVGGRVVALIFGTLLVAPLLAPAVPADLAGAGLPLGPLCLRELLIGMTLALAAALPWAVAHSVGTLLDESLGGAPALPRRRRAAASLYGVLAVALFFGLGGARLTLSALAASYELLPLPTAQHPLAVSSPGPLTASARGLIELSGRLLWLALRLALPLLVAQLLAELLLAVPGTLLGQKGSGRSPVRALIWLGVLLLGARTLFPEFGKLLILWPNLLRLGLNLG